MEYNYCFLDARYDGEEPLYLLILADSVFLNVARTVTDIEGLKQFQEKYFTDFAVEDGYLKCNEGIKNVVVNERVLGLRNKIVPVEQECNVFALFAEGVQQEFLLLADDFGEGECVYAPFRSISFSKSTMSCYCRMVTQEGVYNKMLITVNDSSPALHKFYFATPRTYDFKGTGCVPKGVLSINGIDYNVWMVDSLLVYESNVSLAPSLINRAVNMRDRYAAAKSVISDMVSSFNSTPKNKLPWIGGTSDYSPRYYVFLTSTAKKFNVSAKNEIVKYVMDSMPVMEYEELIRALQMNKGFSSIQVFAGMYLANVLFSMRKHGDDSVGEAINALKRIDYYLMLISMYTYRVRLHSLAAKIHLAPSEFPVLSGGREHDCTIVEGVFQYVN